MTNVELFAAFASRIEMEIYENNPLAARLCVESIDTVFGVLFSDKQNDMLTVYLTDLRTGGGYQIKIDMQLDADTQKHLLVSEAIRLHSEIDSLFNEWEQFIARQIGAENQ